MKSVIVGRIQLQDIPGSALKKGTINGRTVVVGDHYDNNTLGFFIPEEAIIPDNLAEDMWVKGKLAGKKGNRVKGKEMAGIFSEGLFYGAHYWTKQDGQFVEVTSRNWNPAWKEGQDITEETGITWKVA